MTDDQTLKLSRIFNRCLLDLEAVGNFDLRSSEREQAMQILSDAVDAVLNVKGQRCPMCNSPVKVICINCRDRLY